MVGIVAGVNGTVVGTAPRGKAAGGGGAGGVGTVVVVVVVVVVVGARLLAGVVRIVLRGTTGGA